ncbi:MAG: GTPase [Gammaproteobacteria bacterium]|nr:GTPase [Gammaproteobacteria bacterium]
MKLIFVYNADSGLFNTVSDIAHKVLSPKTYSCNLCALTHGHFKIKQEWVEFLEQIDTELEFLHRDEFLKKYHQDNAELPAIFIEVNNELSPWLDQASINQIQTLDDLKAAIMARKQ